MKGEDFLGYKITKAKITKLATDLITRPFPSEEFNNDDDSVDTNSSNMNNNNMTLSQQLQLQLQREEPKNVIEIGAPIIRNEMTLYEKNSYKRLNIWKNCTRLS